MVENGGRGCQHHVSRRQRDLMLCAPLRAGAVSMISRHKRSGAAANRAAMTVGRCSDVPNAGRLAWQKQGKRLFDRAFEKAAVGFVPWMVGSNAAKLNVVERLQPHKGDRRRHWNKLRAATGLQCSQDAVHFTPARTRRDD